MENNPEKNLFTFIQKNSQFLPSSGHVDAAIWMHYMDTN